MLDEMEMEMEMEVEREGVPEDGERRWMWFVSLAVER